ncbi:glycosyl hydrolase family 38 [Scopulibacillus darangshiensis]|uniref:Glycosyl hydrolase family 38 n=1 Tax=Scopulibacillus darangshiensis TaxID=442528 RepID=A0A4V2SNF5_9BACL|nr:glycoside hydrolase [Scopulibacillus darangshiensis]TCP30986.1 glycosyl hydrolase family 38 [Scopulibacillus darangshiensis]
MNNRQRPYKIKLIQHSHLDIGFTDRQEKIKQLSIDFLKQVIRINEKIESGERRDWNGFKWTCEAYWSVESFLKSESKEWIVRLEQAIKKGTIELTGDYLHLSELIDEQVLVSKLKASREYADSMGVKVNSSMNVDINGCSQGYGNALVDTGIENLFTCVHTHHGMYPLKRQEPFWWEMPNGKRLLVWNGDHYHLGNDLGIEPLVMIEKEEQGNFVTTPVLHEDVLKDVYKRITSYVQELENQEYKYNFIPITVSGLYGDNCPPNGHIMDFIEAWNGMYGDEVFIEMTTVHDLFEELKNTDKEIPTYSGDWPDWWSDGVGSTPKSTKLFREAQRKLRAINGLNTENQYIEQSEIEELENNLILFSEHTWGSALANGKPWSSLAQSLRFRKDMYATQAHVRAWKALDKILYKKGEVLLSVNRPLTFKLINPNPLSVKEVVKLPVLRKWQTILLKDGFKVVEKGNGNDLVYQTENLDSSGKKIELYVELEFAPYEEKIIELMPCKQEKLIASLSPVPRDKVNDVAKLNTNNPVEANMFRLETPFVKIVWKQGDGIVSWIDKQEKKELLRGDRLYNAFTPIYEITKKREGEDIGSVRRHLGRNRKGFHVERDRGKLTNVKVLSIGPLYAKVELQYEMEGVSYFSLVLKAYANSPRVDASIRVNKDSVWEPENVYISLPFAVNQAVETETWFEKTGGLIRPRIDQLPGTCVDFYCIQEGLAMTSNDQGLVICTPDTPLIQMGSLDAKEVVLHGDTEHIKNSDLLYSWAMNNIWETNFGIELGGFHEFSYSVFWGGEYCSPQHSIETCRGLNTGIVSFYYEEN